VKTHTDQSVMGKGCSVESQRFYTLFKIRNTVGSHGVTGITKSTDDHCRHRFIFPVGLRNSAVDGLQIHN